MGFPSSTRVFLTVTSPGEVPGKYRNVIPNFFYWAMSGKALPITGDGTETRDWTYVGDIVNGLLAAGVKDEAIGEAINLGSGVETRVIDIAHEVSRLTGNTLGVMHIQRRDWDAKTRIISSIDKAQRLLGYRPRTTFNEGLKDMCISGLLKIGTTLKRAPSSESGCGQTYTMRLLNTRWENCGSPEGE